MHVLQLIAFGIGITMILYVLLSYETEERRLVALVESTWMDLSDIDKGMSTRIAGFLRRIAARADLVLNQTYGEKLFSFSAFLASCSISILVGFILVSGDNDSSLGYVLTVISLVVGTLAYRIGYLRPTLYIAAVCVIVYLLWLMGWELKQLWYEFRSIIEWDDPTRFDRESLVIGRAFVFLPVAASIVDFLSVAAIRASFRAASQASNVTQASALMVAGTFVAPALVLLVITLGSISFLGAASGNYSWRGNPIISMWVAVVLNTPALASSLTTVSMLLFLFAYRIVLALIPRTLYATLKLKLLDNRKGILSMGVILVGIAYPGSSNILEKIAKTFGG